MSEAQQPERDPSRPGKGGGKRKEAKGKPAPAKRSPARREGAKRRPTTPRETKSTAKAKSEDKRSAAFEAFGRAPTYRHVQRIPLADIDTTDTACQLRFSGWSYEDLLESLKTQGQLEPVHLRGEEPPYKIVDGFRRHGGLSTLGVDKVDAVLHGPLSDEDAKRLAFQLNVARKNLSLLEKINAVYQAEKELGLSREAQAEMFGLSLSTIKRYHRVATFPEHIRQVVDCRVITVEHGRMLREFNVKDAKKWAKRIREEHLTAGQLRKALMSDRGLRKMGRPRQLFTRKNNQIHLRGSLRLQATHAEKEAFIDELMKLIDAVKETMGEDELDEPDDD